MGGKRGERESGEENSVIEGWERGREGNERVKVKER